MSHDNYSKNPQEAAVRIAAGMLDFGMFCMNRYMEECTNAMKLSNYFSKSYTDILYRDSGKAEKISVEPRIEMVPSPEAVVPAIIIPLHNIELPTYGENKTEISTDQINPLVKN